MATSFALHTKFFSPVMAVRQLSNDNGTGIDIASFTTFLCLLIYERRLCPSDTFFKFFGRGNGGETAFQPLDLFIHFLHGILACGAERNTLSRDMKGGMKGLFLLLAQMVQWRLATACRLK